MQPSAAPHFLVKCRCLCYASSSSSMLHSGRQVEEAFACINWKAQEQVGYRGNPVDLKEVHATYSSLLRKCGNARDLALGKELHSELRKDGYGQDTFLGNFLVQMYGNCGSLEDARIVFESMHKRNKFSWNIMVSAYAQNGYLLEARTMFQEMPQRDVVSWNGMIAAYAQNGHLEEARKAFEKMPEWNVVSCNAMVTAYLQNGEVGDARTVFNRMPERTLSSWNATVTGYAQNGHLEDARSMFDKMPERDVISWTALVAAYAQNGQSLEARDLFRQMPERNTVSWNAVIAAYAHRGDMENASNLFSEMPEKDVVALTTMIAGYAQAGMVDNARTMFEQIPKRDRVAWSAMITAYALNGHGRDALELFSLMDLEGVHPDKVTFIGIVEACGSIAACTEGKLIHEDIVQRGLQCDVAVSTALVNMYGRCGSLEEARNVFHRMPQKNVVSRTAMVAALAQNGQLDEARRMFNEMLDRDIVSWNAMISAYAQSSNPKEAFQLLKRMDLDGVQADRITLVTVLDACASSSALAEGKAVHSSISDSTFLSDVMVSTALVDMYGKCGTLTDAKEVFDALPQQNVVSWTAMIAKYAQNGHGEEALELVRLMELDGILPNEITLLNILSACSHVGLFDEGHRYFVSLREEYGIEPSLDHYMCMVDHLGRAGRVTEAEELINSMPFEPDRVAWLTLLGACRSLGDMDRAKHAAEQIHDLDPSNSSSYVLLSNLYASSGVVNR